MEIQNISSQGTWYSIRQNCYTAIVHGRSVLNCDQPCLDFRSDEGGWGPWLGCQRATVPLFHPFFFNQLQGSLLRRQRADKKSQSIEVLWLQNSDQFTRESNSNLGALSSLWLFDQLECPWMFLSRFMVHPSSWNQRLQHQAWCFTCFSLGKVTMTELEAVTFRIISETAGFLSKRIFLRSTLRRNGTPSLPMRSHLHGISGRSFARSPKGLGEPKQWTILNKSEYIS